MNRLLMPMVNEAFFALMEGVASAEDIDRGMKLGTNHPMGPLTLADFIGEQSNCHVTRPSTCIMCRASCGRWLCFNACCGSPALVSLQRSSVTTPLMKRGIESDITR